MKKLLVNIGLFFLYSLTIIVASTISLLVNLGYIVTFPIWAIIFMVKPEKFSKRIIK